MQSHRYDGSQRARVLASVIMCKAVCSRTANQWEREGLFDTGWANMVALWCIKHFRRYGESPGDKIRTIFEDWASENRGLSDEEIDRIEGFLVTLSKRYEADANNSDEYLLDEASRYFNSVRLKRELEAAQIELENGHYQDAHERISNYKKVEMGVGSYYEPAASFDMWEEAFRPQRQRSLVRYSGVLGKFFDGSFCRGEFYAFLAPEKTGKTSYLIDFTYRALRSGNRVAYFECGDGDRDEVLCRLGCRTMLRPEFDATFKFPVGWDNEGNVIRQDRVFQFVEPVDAFQATRRHTRNEGSFKLSVHANSTISAQGIEDQLLAWDTLNWRPDVVVIDYADILSPPRYVKDRIEQIDETWRHLRRISQSRHCLVVTATQANAAAYKAKGLLGREHFSGSKTKNAHVNGIIAINVNEEERAVHCGRISWAARRKNKGAGRRMVKVAGCFQIDAPVILSRW